MNMRWLEQWIARLVFYVMAIILLSWTASLSIAFVRSVLPQMQMAPYFALVVFDGGMIAWLLVFLYHAAGVGQRGTALVMSILDFIGAGILGIAELFLGGQTYTASPQDLGVIALWVIGLWTIANVGAMIAFHLMDPEAMKQIAIKSAYDKVANSALELMGQRMDELGGQAADRMSGEMVKKTMFALTGDLEPKLPQLTSNVLTESREPHDPNRRMCDGVTGGGRPCVRYARPGFKTCWQHSDQEFSEQDPRATDE